MDERAERRQRLGEALRENLQRRKKQARQRQAERSEKGDGGSPVR